MEKIYVAKLGKSVGLKGQMRVFIDSDFPEQFKKGVSFTTNKNKTLTVESINQSFDTVKFVGIDTIEDTKSYINSLLYTTEEESKKNCKLDKKQFFWFEIEQCSVVENGIVLGKVVEINRYPTDDYMTIETDKLLLEKDPKTPKSFLLPYNDNYVQNVDIEKKIITIINGFDILAAS
ncbi:MAG: ribosome maturation factor RimM [Arcobacteraceae bacterium]|jgi:16S rRNA processing protein RimM|nr:ribosome maturation factor RimM [Arcobacteraceae bacterium]